MGERLEGELGRISYAAEDGSWAVANLHRADGSAVTIVGPIAQLTGGSHLVLDGRWSTHARYGKRFRVDGYLIEDPKTLEGLRRYLASGAVHGLGATLAERTVAKFGLETLHILENEPERLREVAGIGKKRLGEIVRCWERDKAGRELAVMLRAHGLGAAVARRVTERYGDEALGVVQRQPYRLASEVPGVGFRTADAIARAHGLGDDHPDRAEALLCWVLDEATSQGHCFLPRRELLERARPHRAPSEVLEAALVRLQLGGRLVVEDEAVFVAALAAAERRVANDLAARGGGEPIDAAVVVDAATRVGLQLNRDQTRAVASALGHRLAVITGGPGTGKTTIVRVLLAAARQRKERWALAAPTGRAARRLQEGCGQEGKTLHRLLEYVPATGFQRNAGNPLELAGLVVDEASMVDLELLDVLLRAVPTKARLVLVGDADQLPSVGAGQVLRDLVESDAVPTVRLTQVYRQAEDSGIVRNAWRILRGEVPVSGQAEAGKRDFFLVPRSAQAAQDTLVQVVRERLPTLGFDPRKDVQVLSPMRKGPLGTRALNERLQAELNPSGRELKKGAKRFRVGDRVLCVRNDYDHDVFNGDVGVVASIEPPGLSVDFDGRRVGLVGDQLEQLELAYAVTIHKSQGSEYPAVVVALDTGHFVMLRRNLVYTAVTRAKRFCCIVGAPRALETAVGRRGEEIRYTRLGTRLRDSG